MLTVGSTFTGVGGADLGLEWAGFRIAWQCELDPWKRSILAAHWPDTPIHDDITTLHDPEPVDVMIGGFPCQDLSVAGKRKGFDGERSVLAFEFLRVAESLAPRWLILENVPGLLSSNRGRDFARLIDEVVGCGYGVAWRVLDARYFGVPQRRRRVFLVARRADTELDTRAAARLALRALWEGSSGDLTPGWPPRQDTPADAGIRAESGGREPDVSPTVTAKWRKGTGGPAGDECQNLVSFYPTGGSQQGFWSSDGVSPTLKVGSGIGASSGNAVCFRKSKRMDAESAAGGHLIPTGFSAGQSSDAGSIGYEPGMSPTLRAAPSGSNQVPTLHEHTTVRRLTPVECERLMGWPDGWTAPEGVKAPDSKRYAACGDGIVSWVAYWIGQRIRMIEEEA